MLQTLAVLDDTHSSELQRGVDETLNKEKIMTWLPFNLSKIRDVGVIKVIFT